MKIEFEIDTDNIVAFADILSDNDIKNRITGTTEEGNLLVDVNLDKDNRELLEELEDLSENED
jgi:hypothetical protein